MPKLDRDGIPIYDQNDPYPLDPSASRNALTGGVQGITDPTPRDATLPTPTTPPSEAPPNQHWDPTQGQFVDNAAQVFTPTAAAPTGRTDEAAIRAQIAQWAAMPGADPSLGGNPDYWVQAINSRGGLGDDNRQYWQDASVGPTAFINNPNRESGGAAPAAAPASGGLGASNPQEDALAAFNERIRQILLQQISGLSDVTTADDPEVQPAISAFNTQSQRDQQTNRDALAERFYAAGDGGNTLDSGGFNTSVKQGLEKASTDRANFTGSTVFQAAQSKRTQLMQMLQTATGAGLTGAAQQIQAKIAAIDADLRRQGLNQQNTQFNQSLGQQNSQFGDSLGFNYAQLLAQENRDTLLAGLNG